MPLKIKAVLATIVLLASSCSIFDDSDIWDKLQDHEARIEELEKSCNELNSNLAALRVILEAVQQQDYITDITRIMENGIEVGYSMTFSKGGTITIYHGSDGHSPKIGIKKANDGEYYWTADGEWLTDEDGEKIAAAVLEESDSGYITPRFRVADGHWYISYDDGNTWRQLEGEQTGGESIFTSVTYDSQYVYIELSDGETVKIARSEHQKEFTIQECYDAFIAEMNQKAKALGATNSKFVDPIGIKNTSTARDLTLIMLNASGYDKLYDCWSTSKYRLNLIQPDGSIRHLDISNLVTGRAKSHILCDSYNIIGGKSGSLTGKSLYNLVSICQSNKNPDDLYIIAALRAHSSHDGDKSPYHATKEIMDIIESWDGQPKHDSLDDLAWEGLSYKDIFINSNKSTRLNSSSLGGYTINSGAPEIIYNAEAADNYVPYYSLKCFGSKSQQLKSPKVLDDYPYFVAGNVKIDRYNKGYCGVAFGKNFKACLSGITDGWQPSSAILTGWDGDGDTRSTYIYIGSCNSADLDGYVNNPVVIPMSIFKTKPTEEELDSLYREYNDRLIEMAYDNTTDFADICCDYAYAIKMPKYNPRGHKHLEVEPIFSKNPHTTEYTASTTKLLTSLILLEYAPYLKEKVTIREEDVAYATGGFYKYDLLAGETITYEDLLYAMLLQSSNSACAIVATHIGELILRSRTL